MKEKDAKNLYTLIKDHGYEIDDILSVGIDNILENIEITKEYERKQNEIRGCNCSNE
jgi:hypothetical protein